MIAKLWLLLLFLQEEPKLEVSVEEFLDRRTRLMERIADGVGVLDSGSTITFQTSAAVFDFVYLAGYHEDECILALVPSEKKLILFVRETEKAKQSAVRADVRSLSDFEKFASERLSREKIVYSKLKQVHLDVVTKHNENVEGKTLGAELTRLRLIKSKREQELIRRSTDISCRAHVRAMKTLKPGLNEKDIQKVYEEEFAKSFAVPGYSYICGAGINGCTLHYSANDQEIPKDSLIVCDCGSAYQGYVTDVTRTLPTSGKFTKAQREKYQLVRDSQKAAEAILKPGVTLRQLHDAAAKVFQDSGHTKWAFSHSADRTVQHGLGHFVGLYVHDSGSWQTKLEPGMVITIEPGWYDKDQQWGIRIEDMYLVTAEGYEHLSKAAPREIEEIERVMAGK